MIIPVPPEVFLNFYWWYCHLIGPNDWVDLTHENYVVILPL